MASIGFSNGHPMNSRSLPPDVVAETSHVAGDAVGDHHDRLRAELWQRRIDEYEWRDHCDLVSTFEAGKLRERPVDAA